MATLESTHLKLDRAWQHLAALEDEVEEFLDAVRASSTIASMRT